MSKKKKKVTTPPPPHWTKKSVEKFLKERKVNYEWTENGDFWIKRCSLGAGGYEYGEKPTPIEIKDRDLREIANLNFVCVIDCEDCFGCGSW